MFGTAAAMRILALALLVLGLSAGTTAADSAAGVEGTKLKVELGEWSLGFAKAKASSGKLTVQLVNVGKYPHNFVVRKKGLISTIYKSPLVKGSQSATVKIDLPAGSYELFCSVPGHEDLGMLATLTVGE